MTNDKHVQWQGGHLEVSWGERAHRATLVIQSGEKEATALVFDEGGYRAHYRVANDKVAGFIDVAARAWRERSKGGSIAVVWRMDMVAMGILHPPPPPPPPGPPGDEFLVAGALAAHHNLLGFTELAFERGHQAGHQQIK